MVHTVERIAGGNYSGSAAAPGGTTATLNTDGPNRLCVAVFFTERQLNGAPDYHAVASVTGGTGMTWSKVVNNNFTYNDAVASGSFPNNYWHVDVFKSFAAAQQTTQSLTITMAAAGDNFVNHGWGVVFTIDGPTDLDTDITNLVVNSSLAGGGASTMTTGSIDTDSATPLVLVAMLNHKSGGSANTHTIPSGFSTAASISGNAHFNTGGSGSGGQADISVSFKEYASAQTGLVLTGSSEDYWYNVAIVLAPVGGSTTQLLATSVAAEVMHKGGTSTARVTSAAAEAMITGASAGRVTSVAAEVMVATAPAPPLDGSRFLEASFQTKSTLRFSNADYNSIYSMGDRATSGIMTFGHYGTGISPGATMGSSHEGNYAFPTGSGLALDNPMAAGAAAWLDFNGEEVEIHAFKLIGTEEFAWDDDDVWSFYGGISIGDYSTTPYGKEFDGFVPSQNIENTDLGMFETEFATTPRDGQAWNHYEFVFLAGGTHSVSRFANEILYKVAHSTLDGGDRRPTNGDPSRRVAFTMSSDWTFTNDAPNDLVDPQNALFDGVPVYFGFPAPAGDTKNGLGDYSIISDPVETNGVQTTIGAWFQFVFPREVTFKHLMLIVENQVEEYDSGDLPMHYGTWHFEYSKDSGGSWHTVGDPWSFSEDAKYMVAPRTGRFSFSDPALGNGATHWRMVLNSGPAFRASYVLSQFIFNLDDIGGLSATLAIAFSDDTDGVPVTITLVGASPFTIAFTDGSTDELDYDLSNVPNFDGTLAFSDGTSDELQFFSELLPSSVSQTIVVATGR